MVYDEAKNDRHDYYLHYAQEHPHDIYVDFLSCKEEHKGGRYYRGKERGDARHSYAQSDVAFGKIAYHIACRSSRTASYEYHAEGEL